MGSCSSRGAGAGRASAGHSPTGHSPPGHESTGNSIDINSIDINSIDGGALEGICTTSAAAAVGPGRCDPGAIPRFALGPRSSIRPRICSRPAASQYSGGV